MKGGTLGQVGSAGAVHPHPKLGCLGFWGHGRPPQRPMPAVALLPQALLLLQLQQVRGAGGG